MIELVDKSKCTGCTACKNICQHSAITMSSDNEGFLYPCIDLNKCVECGLCRRICPIYKRDTISYECNILNAYVAHHNNEDIWYNSSSGGVFTAITEYVFENGGVVYGAAYGKEWDVFHEAAYTKEEAIKFRGSKYVQSDLTNIFSQIKSELQYGRLVLFSGTPCQVAGLNEYLNKPYENLLTVDLICHCVPSPKIYKDYINYIQSRYKKKIVKINMKDKTLGWNKLQTPRIYFEDGSSIFNVADSLLWETIFYSHIAIRPSCHTCRFSNLNRVGDITIGDYWGVENYHPEYNHHNGASILLINTPKGQVAFKSFSTYLIYEITDPIKALPSSLVYATTPHPKRGHFWEDYDNLTFVQLCRKYFELGFYNKLKKVIYRSKVYIKKILKIE